MFDIFLDKINTLLSNSSHKTNIYVKDNATIIYNGHKNDDYVDNYLEKKNSKLNKNCMLNKNCRPPSERSI